MGVHRAQWVFKSLTGAIGERAGESVRRMSWGAESAAVLHGDETTSKTPQREKTQTVRPTAQTGGVVKAAGKAASSASTRQRRSGGVGGEEDPQTAESLYINRGRCVLRLRRTRRPNFTRGGGAPRSKMHPQQFQPLNKRHCLAISRFSSEKKSIEIIFFRTIGRKNLMLKNVILWNVNYLGWPRWAQGANWKREFEGYLSKEGPPPTDRINTTRFTIGVSFSMSDPVFSIWDGALLTQYPLLWYPSNVMCVCMCGMCVCSIPLFYPAAPRTYT